MFPETLKKTQEFQDVPITGSDKAAEVAIFNNLKRLAEEYQEEDIDKSTVLDKEIATKLELDNRIYAFSERDSFITIKDHKDN